MARTYRRKQDSSCFPEYWKSVSEWHKNWYRKRHPGLTDEEIIRKKCIKYHADNHSGKLNPPSEFGKVLNKKIKKSNQLNLIRCIRNNEEFIEIPLKRDSGHDYF